MREREEDVGRQGENFNNRMRFKMSVVYQIDQQLDVFRLSCIEFWWER